MESYPTKLKSFQPKIVQMGASQKLQITYIQILIILWLVCPIHTNSLFSVIFEELSFSHFPPLNTSVLGKDSQIQLIFHLNILVFQTNGKQPYSFPVLSRFCNFLLGGDGRTATRFLKDSSAFSNFINNSLCPLHQYSQEVCPPLWVEKPGLVQLKFNNVLIQKNDLQRISYCTI